VKKKYIRFRTLDGAVTAYGEMDEHKIVPLKQAPWNGIQPTDNAIPVEKVELLAPVRPSKIVCIGLNYHAHVKASYSADEAPENPLIFLKPPSSIIGPHGKIVHPEASERVDYEAELGVVIGTQACNVSREEAISHVFGYTCVNDVTARDLQKKDGQWSRAKGFDTFCPVGPWIVTDYDYRDVLVEGIHNGETRQSGRTSQMIFPVDYLISYISQVMTLEPGDLISTGTPSGIAPMKSGDTIVVRVEGIGSLENSMA
jgi:2-keto-4-pentenoate hydratase/2-oxohepta-3-ene-1,7-dioic acid hydratase in catechol pathway